MLKKMIESLPGFRRLARARDRLEAELAKLGHPPGHFYSPIPDGDEVSARFADLSAPIDVQIAELTSAGIQLAVETQKGWLEKVARHYDDQPFSQDQSEGLRYYFANNMFLESDALFLYGLLREVQPNRVVEVGSGFSSAVMLDTAERFLDGGPRFTFIEPNPSRLQRLLRDSDRSKTTIHQQIVQAVTAKPWEELQSGDMLFIDSSHVAKCGSDVQYLFQRVVPQLAAGTLIHIHDISFPFEYPESWITERKWAWNEAYLVQSFLQFNEQFEMVAWVPFLNLKFPEFIEQNMPLCRRDHGGSLWIRKTA